MNYPMKSGNESRSCCRPLAGESLALVIEISSTQSSGSRKQVLHGAIFLSGLAHGKPSTIDFATGRERMCGTTFFGRLASRRTTLEGSWTHRSFVLIRTHLAVEVDPKKRDRTLSRRPLNEITCRDRHQRSSSRSLGHRWTTARFNNGAESDGLYTDVPIGV